MYKILIKNLTINFRIYHDRSPSLKERFANFFKKTKQGEYTDYSALDSISIEIKNGDRVGIVGRNGAGKSTLLKAICRVYESETGSVITHGKIAPLLEIGAGFHPEFSGRENIYLNAAILGYEKSYISMIENQIIDFAEIREFIDMPVKYYSTGMYMKLAFSLATAVEPDILILDEMFAGGDASFVKKAKERMSNLIDSAKIMVMVSHDHELVRAMCNRVVWMDQGKVRADGDPSEIIGMYLKNG